MDDTTCLSNIVLTESVKPLVSSRGNISHGLQAHVSDHEKEMFSCFFGSSHGCFLWYCSYWQFRVLTVPENLTSKLQTRGDCKGGQLRVPRKMCTTKGFDQLVQN